MTANIVTIGDEILIGQILDSNSKWIAEELNKIGVSINRIESISDKQDDIISALDRSLPEVDLIILTGGLGPTNDDRTKDALIEYFGSQYKRHQPTLEKIERFLKIRGIKANEINLQQADLPDNCEILTNEPGAVPGMLFKKEGKVIVSVPGVPYEMKSIIGKELVPYLKDNYDLPQILHRTFMTVGIAESTLAIRLKPFEDDLPDYYSIAYLPSPGKVRIRLSAIGGKNDNISLGFPEVQNQLRLLLDRDFYGYDEITLEELVGKKLKKRKLTVCTAESCTGGNIANALTNIPGASDYFRGSIVCYSNDVKTRLLNVSSEAIEEHGAVSKQVVIQMAENARKLIKTDIAVATSGIAGPSGGTQEKPVGLVWIAITSPRTTLAFQYNFGEHRGRTISRTTLTALNHIRLEIEKMEEVLSQN